jgi:hypothetical protein
MRPLQASQFSSSVIQHTQRAITSCTCLVQVELGSVWGGHLKLDSINVTQLLQAMNVFNGVVSSHILHCHSSALQEGQQFIRHSPLVSTRS